MAWARMPARRLCVFFLRMYIQPLNGPTFGQSSSHGFVAPWDCSDFGQSCNECIHATQASDRCSQALKRANRHTPELAMLLKNAALFGTGGALTAPRPFCGYGYWVLTWHARALKCRLGVACGGVANFSNGVQGAVQSTFKFEDYIGVASESICVWKCESIRRQYTGLCTLSIFCKLLRELS